MGDKYNSADDLGNYSLTQGTIRGKKQPDYPVPPDPAYVADQQMRINRDAARGSLIDQSGPFGSLKYEDIGDGRFRAVSALDPSETGAIFGARSAATEGLSGFRSKYGGGSADFSGDRQRIEDALYKRATGRLDEQYGRGEEQTRARLLAQGATEGSEAWKNAMQDFNTQKRDDYDFARQSAILGGGQEQSRLDDLASRRRGQEFGEIGGLFELGRLASFTPRGQGNAGIGPADYQGAVENQYAGQLGAYSDASARSAANRQANTQMLGSLIGMFMKCDRGLKENYEAAPSVLDKLAALPVECWNYKGDSAKHIGPYAQDWAALFGGDGKTIAAIDLFGVLLKSVQELAAEVRSLKHG